MPTYTATDYEPVPPGLYTARLENIEEATSAHGTYYRWQFVVEDEGEQEDRRVYANVSDKFGPQSKARRWCEQMMGRSIRKGEQLENVHRIRTKAEPNQEKAGQPEDPEGEFNDIPW
jgi:hypothetical protein